MKSQGSVESGLVGSEFFSVVLIQKWRESAALWGPMGPCFYGVKVWDFEIPGNGGCPSAHLSLRAQCFLKLSDLDWSFPGGVVIQSSSRDDHDDCMT